MPTATGRRPRLPSGSASSSVCSAFSSPDSWPDAPEDACRGYSNDSSYSRFSETTVDTSSPSESDALGDTVLDANTKMLAANDWPRSPCNSRPASPTRPAGVCTLEDEDVLLHITFELDVVSLHQGLHPGYPPPAMSPACPRSPTSPTFSFPSSSLADAVCACGECPDPREPDGWFEVVGECGLAMVPERRLSDAHPLTHVMDGLECNAGRHGNGQQRFHRQDAVNPAGEHRRTGSSPAILRQHSVQDSPYHLLLPNSLRLVGFDEAAVDYHLPMPNSHDVYESFDGELFDHHQSATSTSGDRERWRVSLSSLSSIKRSLSLNRHGHRTTSGNRHHHYPYQEGSQTHISSSGGDHIDTMSPLTSIPRSVSSNEGSLHSPRRRPVSYAPSSNHHHPRNQYASDHAYHRPPGARLTSIMHHSHYTTSPPSLPGSPAPSSFDTYSGLGSPALYGTAHGPRSPDTYSHSNSHPAPPSIASVSAASTHHRLPPSGPSSPRPETMSYTSIPSTTLRLDGFDTRLFDGSSPSLIHSPLPRVPSPAGRSAYMRDKPASMISSVASESTASRSVRDYSGETTSQSLRSGTRARDPGPFNPPDEYGLGDFAISRSSPVLKPNRAPFHDAFQTAHAISLRSTTIPLAPPSFGVDHIADLSPTLAPTTAIPATPLDPPSSLRGAPTTPPTTTRQGRPIRAHTDGRVFTPSPILSHSSRDPTPQGSVLSTPFEERDYHPSFGSLPTIPIHPLAPFSGTSGARTAGPSSLTVRHDHDHLDEHGNEGGLMMHAGLHVHKHRGHHSPRPSPDPSPKGSPSQLQSDARSIKSNKQRRPAVDHGAYPGGPVDNYDSAPHRSHPISPPSPQLGPGSRYHLNHHGAAPPPPSSPRSAPRPPMLDTDFNGGGGGYDVNHHQPRPGPSLRNMPAPDAVHFQNSAGRRGNRISQMTTSSVSSDTSTAISSSVIRGHPWGLPSGFEKRPSVATVFEDEPLDDVEYDGASGVHEFSNRTGEWQPERDAAAAYRTHTRTSGGLQLSTSAPSSTRMYGGPPASRTHRASTMSTATTSSARSKGSTHPFAVNRAPSPLLAVPEQVALPAAANTSRSLPSLYDGYKAHVDRPAHQVALVSAEDEQDDAICPLCTESLSFSYRLPGEKPHIVPECGHALHNDCFVECYGRVPPEGSRPNLGVCGMCRQPMVISSGGQDRGAGKNKLAALMGGDDGPSMGASGYDDKEDDAIENNGYDDRASPNEAKILVPNISIRSEFPSVRRNAKGKQSLTAMLTVEVPPSLHRGYYAPRSRREGSNGELSPQLPPSPLSATSFRESMIVMANGGGSSHFANLELDLRDRVEDYPTSGIAVMGHLKLYDILKVRKRDVSGELQLYLFDHGLVCISEERRSSTLRHLFGNHRHPHEKKKGPKTYLKVRGRVHMHHVLNIQDTSTNSEYVLTLEVETEDEGHHLFHIYFRDSGSLEMWKGTMRRLREDCLSPHMATSKASKLTGVSMAARAPRNPPPTPTMTPPTFTDFVDSCATTCGPQCPGDLAFQVPLAPQHTPIDLVIAVSTVPLQPGARLGRKQLTLRSALQCALACIGPSDRIALVSTELGLNGVVRRTPLLNATHHDSRLRLENFVDMLCLGRLDNDEFEVQSRLDERPDVATAVNHTLDIVLGRKSKNPLTGVLLVSDLPEATSRTNMGMVNARLEAAQIQIHSFGYGKTHEPSPLWAITNQTNGTYTFVREWHDLRDAVVGCVGGLMSIAVTHMKLRLACTENDFRVQKVSGAISAIVHSSGKTVDVELHILRHSERRQILIEFEAMDPNDPPSPETRLNENPMSPIDDDVRSHHSLGRKESMITSAASVRSRPSIRGPIAMGMGMDMLSVQEEDGGILEEVPVIEVDCSFHDPAAGRTAARLTNPVLLTMAVLSSGHASTATPDPTIVRRRMELVTSDMITRSVLAASRKNWDQAIKMLRGTKRTVEALCDKERLYLTQLQAGRGESGNRSRRELVMIHAIEGLSATAQDVDAFLDGLEESREMFEADHRNYAAQQAVILKTQRSWTMRTPTELHYATGCVQQVIQAGREWKARQGTN